MTPCGFSYPFIFTICPGVCPSPFIGSSEGNNLNGGAVNGIFDGGGGIDSLLGGRGNDLFESNGSPEAGGVNRLRGV